MKKIYLHIGPPKTGSTAIQSVLHAGAAEMLKQGILYPRSGRAFDGQSLCLVRKHKRTRLQGPLSSHLILGYVLRGHIEGWDADLCWRTLLEECAASEAGSIVLSAEVFGNLESEHVTRIREYLAPFEVEIILYLRDPFARLVSQYTQGVKMGRVHQSFKHYASEHAAGLVDAYQGMLNRWAGAFGADQLIVKNFDRIVAGPDGLVDDFLSTLGLDPLPFRDYASSKSMNSSPRPELVRLMLTLNAFEARLSRRPYRQAVFDRVRLLLRQCESASGALCGVLRYVLKPFSRPLFNDRDRSRVEELTRDAFHDLDKYSL